MFLSRDVEWWVALVQGGGDVLAELGFHEMRCGGIAGEPLAAAVFAGVFDDAQFGDLDAAGRDDLGVESQVAMMVRVDCVLSTLCRPFVR
ncbi:hypothetical protein [Cryobacterium sp. N21]|uniref:hypothetical protein n=1 Tax=Cryobacterium sp. N21 TaxID=2048289 RepID=UPI001124F0D6|nr:hypothetical protein [Cryobacterium sp. N21]